MISIDRPCLDPSSDFRRNPRSYLDLQFRTEKVGEPNVKGKRKIGWCDDPKMVMVSSQGCRAAVNEVDGENRSMYVPGQWINKLLTVKKVYVTGRKSVMIVQLAQWL